MNPPLLIDGVRCETEKAVRDYAFNFTSGDGKFKQDFRLAAGAYSLPLIQVIELLNSTGHTVEPAPVA